MKTIFLFLLIGLSTAYPQGGRLIENPLKDIPKWVRAEISSRRLDEHYTILYRLYPHCIRGDFNGDGKRDAAIQVQERSSGKLGVAIFHAKKAQALHVPVTVLGAGKGIGSAGDDFKWADLWSVRREGSTAGLRGVTPPEMHGDGLALSKHGGKSGFIYWDGSKYTWQKLGR
jgi:hypothetical protein